MVVTDRIPDAGSVVPAGAATPAEAERPALPALEPILPLLVTATVLAGLVLALMVTPIGSGDYGQWLMTSRPFLGEAVPAYRDLGDVPPVVPFLLALIRAAVPDPLAALHVLSTILLLGLGASLYALGTVALASRWGGALTVVLGLLVTDRFTDLFAFGGLLQVAALAFGCGAFAATLRAARAPVASLGSWGLAVVALALAAMTHVGTGLIVVPIGLALAAIVALVALARARWDPDPVVARLLRPGLAFAAVGLYWLVVLVPDSADYVTNPASLAYRGPDRLWVDLFERWPTAMVIVVGAAGLTLATVRAVLGRRFDGLLLVAAWTVLTWSLLAWSVVSGSATDFPRFATPLVAPLLVGAAAALLWALHALADWLRNAGWRGPRWLVVSATVVLIVLVTAPLTIERHVRQSDFYELRDADGLRAASAWIDAEVPTGRAVLADVREGKWIEGLTGRPALFSQSVRYAFRPEEWQRSTDADALLRSTLTLTSGYVAAQFTGRVPLEAGDPEGVPNGLVVRANHGGEFVDLLRLGPSATTFDGGVSASSLFPMRSTPILDDRWASVRTVWGLRDVPGFAYTQTVTAFIEGTTLRLVQAAPGHVVTSDLMPASGVTIISADVHPDEARVCFTELGGSNPCLLLRTTDGEGRLSTTPDGGLRVTSGASGEIELLITAVTAGDASVGLGILEPAALVESYDVGAVLLHRPDPATDARVGRLEAIGFEEGPSFGTYRVLVRDSGAGS